MSYDGFLNSETNRHLDEQSRPNFDTCSWCGSVQLSEDMIDKHLESFCSDYCLEKFQEDIGMNEAEDIGMNEAEEKME